MNRTVCIFLIACVLASTSSIINNKKQQKPKYDFSDITTPEAVYAQVANSSLDFFEKFEQVLKDVNTLATDGFEDESSAMQQVEDSFYYVKKAIKYVPADSDSAKNLKALKEKLAIAKFEAFIPNKSIEEKRNKKSKAGTKIADYKKVVDFRAEAITGIIQAFKIIDISKLLPEYSFKIAKFLGNFAEHINFHDIAKITEYRRKIRALKKRELVIKVAYLAADFENIELVYATYAHQLLEICQKTLPFRKGTISRKLTRLFFNLASVVSDYARAGAESEELQESLHIICQKERETIKLYSLWKKIHGVVEEMKGSESACGTESE